MAGTLPNKICNHASGMSRSFNELRQRPASQANEIRATEYNHKAHDRAVMRFALPTCGECASDE